MSDIIENLTVFVTYIIIFFYHVPLYIMMCDNKDFIIIMLRKCRGLVIGERERK